MTPAAEVSLPSLQLTAHLAELATHDAIAGLCDAIVADLQTLCREVRARGEDAVTAHYNRPYSTHPYVSTSGWSTRTAWYHGWYIGIGLNHREPSLGFLSDKVIMMLRDRFKKEQVRVYKADPSSIESIGGTVHINSDIYNTPRGIFMLTHTHSWYVRRMID